MFNHAQIHALIDRRRPEEAERLALEALKSDPEDFELHMLLVVALFAQNKYKAATERAQDLIGLEPEVDIGHFWLARCLEERSRHKEALKSINTALELDPDDAESWSVKASCLVALNRRDDAMEAVTRGLAADPDNDSCRFYHSVLLGRKGDHDEADEASLGLLRDEPDSAESQNARGWVLLTKGDAEGAERHFIEALRIAPGYEDARCGLVEAMKSRDFIMSSFMRFLLWVDDLPWFYVIGGIIGVSFIRRTLSGMDNPALSLVGDIIGIVVLGLVVLFLTVTPLFNLVLANSKRGRLALSEREKSALKWAALPLCFVIYSFISWAFRSGNGMPVHCIAWASVVALIGYVPESRNAGVRFRMTLVTIGAALGAIALIFIGYLVILPDLLDVIAQIGEQTEANEEEASAKLKQQLIAVLDKKKWLMDYPALGLLLLASFREDVRNYFERRAADEA